MWDFFYAPSPISHPIFFSVSNGAFDFLVMRLRARANTRFGICPVLLGQSQLALDGELG
jgi:hypothetical protein